MDRAIFVGTAGTDILMRRMEVLTNNLANAATPGFRADFTSPQHTGSRSDDKNESRIFPSVAQTWSDFSAGPVTATGRDLDVALNGQGFIAVQSATGREGYTRAGNLHIRDGLLVTGAGQLVLGAAGVINIPRSAERLSIAPDGTVSVKLRGTQDPVPVGHIKLVNPKLAGLQKGEDGLIYPAEGAAAAQRDVNVRLTPGALEGSNVNTVRALTDLVQLSREFEMQTRLMKSIQDDAEQSNSVLTVSGG